ncbi:MAG: enoyl-CoA hydratase [Hyphomonadaceae bacterium]
MLLKIDRSEGPVASIALARPEARNALSLELIDALIETFAALAADQNVRVVVLHAEGPVFSSGHDLKELNAHRSDADSGRAFFERTFARCGELMQAIVAAPQPVIAAIEGTATAAGCQLVASCDLAIAGGGARFATPGVNIGLFCTTPAVALSRAAHAKHAMEMLLTGDMIDAESAHRIGLVSRIVPAGEAHKTANDLAARIASKSPSALAFGKKAFHAQRALPLDEAYALAGGVMVENMLDDDAVEGIAAFIEKRDPRWPS